MIPFYMKKWYLDLISDDGAVIYLYFIATRIAGIRGGNISAHITLPDGESWHASMNHRVTLLDSAGGAACGQSYLVDTAGGANAHFVFPQLDIALRYQSSGTAWAPTEGGLLLQRNGQYLSWNVPLPAAAADGVIRSGSKLRRVSGRGYQDIVEMTLPPWRLPIAELNWGRAHCGDYTVVFDRVRTTDGACLQYVMLRTEKTDSTMIESQAFTLEPEEGEHNAVLRHDSFTLHFMRRGILAEGEITAGGQIRSGWLRKIVGNASGNPFERKLVADATLHFANQTFEGRAIHESVSWHWK
jgi:hypothetical protein